MKKVLALVAIASSVALFSCNQGNKENTNAGQDTAKMTTPAPDTSKKMTMPADTAHKMSTDTSKMMKK